MGRSDLFHILDQLVQVYRESLCTVVLPTILEIQKVLQTYSFEEIAEHNEILIEDVIEMLISEYNWTLPNPEPLQ